jgi:hypothetical protein
LFDLGKDNSEQIDLAKANPEKIAELTKLHDAWLAEMLVPMKAGAKRWGQEPPPGHAPNKPKKPKSERKKNRL